MISKIIKDFFLKRKVNKKLINYQLQVSTDKIVKVGVLIDGNYFTHQEELIEEITKGNLNLESINSTNRLFLFSNRLKSAVGSSFSM